MPSTNFHNLARAREVVAGVIPASPKMRNCFLTNDSFKIAKQFEQSETITGNRGIIEHLPVGIAVEGSANFEFAYGYVDWCFELLNFDSFAALEEAHNETADSAVTDINATTQTVLADGDWVEGMLIELEGHPVAGNNARFRAAAGTGAGTIVAPAGTLSDADAAPPAGVNVYCYGFEGASGDISATATGLASASNAFANLPLLPYMGLRIGGGATDEQFATAALNTFVGVKSVAADGSAIELDELPPDWAPDAGAAKRIQLFIGDDSRTGEDVLTDVLQRRNRKNAANTGRALVGVAGQSMSLALGLNARVTGSANLVGFTGMPLDPLIDADPADPVKGPIMKTGANIARLTEGGAPYSAGIEAQSVNYAWNNNLTPVGDLEKDEAIDWNPGDATLTITAVNRARTSRIFDKFYNEEDSRHMAVLRRGRYAYQLRMLKGTYTDYDDPVEGRNGEWTSSSVLSMKLDPENDGLFVVTRYRRWQ